MLCVEWPLAANLKVGRHWAPTDYNFVFSFAHEFQLINVPDLNGVGESEPNPYFYQARFVGVCAVSAETIDCFFFFCKKHSLF